MSEPRAIGGLLEEIMQAWRVSRPWVRGAAAARGPAPPPAPIPEPARATWRARIEAEERRALLMEHHGGLGWVWSLRARSCVLCGDVHRMRVHVPDTHTVVASYFCWECDVDMRSRET